MSPVAGTYVDAPDEACRDSRRMLQEAIISARKELEAAKLSARAELDAKHQQLQDIRQESETLAVEPEPKAAELASMSSPERLAAEQKAMVNWEKQHDEDQIMKRPDTKLPVPQEVAPSASKENPEVPVPTLKQKSGMSDLEERLMFGAGPHCEGSRSPKKRKPEKTGLMSIEVIQSEHQAQRESMAKALAAHEEELVKERELRVKALAAHEEHLMMERELRVKEATAYHLELEKAREEWTLQIHKGAEQLAEERQRHEVCESELAEERELRREQAAANTELKQMLEKSGHDVASLRDDLRTKEMLLEKSAREMASLVEQHVTSPSLGSAASAAVKAKAGALLRSQSQQKTPPLAGAQAGNGLARRLFEGDAPIAPPFQERTPKWPTPARALAVASPCHAPDEAVKPVQGSVLKRINALERATYYEQHTTSKIPRPTSQPPPLAVPLGAKPTLHQDASETTPRGKVSCIRHELERRAAALPKSVERPAPSTSPRNASWVPDCNAVGSQSAREVRWVKGSAASTPASSLVKERVRRLENGGR